MNQLTFAAFFVVVAMNIIIFQQFYLKNLTKKTLENAPNCIIFPIFSGEHAPTPLNNPFRHSIHSITVKISKRFMFRYQLKWVWLEEYAKYMDDEKKVFNYLKFECQLVFINNQGV